MDTSVIIHHTDPLKKPLTILQINTSIDEKKRILRELKTLLHTNGTIGKTGNIELQGDVKTQVEAYCASM
jgi:translation initiation factor 1 (eIF-1/SUI1)